MKGRGYVMTCWPRFQGGRRSHGSLPSSPPCACGPGRASSLPCQPNFRGERSPNLVRPGQAVEAQLVDTGLARQHRGRGSRDWELVDGSESAAATPVPAALLAGTRGKVTGHPLSPDDPPQPHPPALYRHSPSVTEGLLAPRLLASVATPVCLRPAGWKVGGTGGLALRLHSVAPTSSPVVLEPSASRPSPPGCSLREQPKVG